MDFSVRRTRKRSTQEYTFENDLGKVNIMREEVEDVAVD